MLDTFDISNIGFIAAVIIGCFFVICSVFYFFIPFWIKSINKNIKKQLEDNKKIYDCLLKIEKGINLNKGNF